MLRFAQHDSAIFSHLPRLRDFRVARAAWSRRGASLLNWLMEPEYSQTDRNGPYPQIGLRLKP